MTANQKSAAIFCSRVDELVDSHLLLFQKALSNLLKCIATTPTFIEALSDSLAHVSYVEEFERSRVFYFKDGKAHLKFVLPADKYRCFSLVVCLLAEIDEGRRNFLQFLQEFFPDTDDFASFQRFCNGVLYPFKNAGESILLGERTFLDDDEADSALTSCLTDDDVKQLTKEIETLCKTINGDSFRSASSRNECTLAAVSLGNAILKRDDETIRQAWVGLKNTAKVNKLGDDDLLSLYRVLSQAGLA